MAWRVRFSTKVHECARRQAVNRHYSPLRRQPKTAPAPIFIEIHRDVHRRVSAQPRLPHASRQHADLAGSSIHGNRPAVRVRGIVNFVETLTTKIHELAGPARTSQPGRVSKLEAFDPRMSDQA